MLSRAGMASSVAATTLAEAAATERDEAAGEVEPRPPWRRGRAGTAVGRAVHAVLQSIDLETGAGLDATARAQALAEGVADREGEVRDLVASVLATPLVREAVTQGWDSWRELPVAAEVGGILVEGFIDLLVRSPDGLVVVDYKTDVVASDADVGAAVRRYALQGAAYAVALEAALGEPVIRCVFVFARLPRAAEQQIPDLGAATAAVRERLAAIAG
jgi:ATP-dependent helicase/nuclease subunit A